MAAETAAFNNTPDDEWLLLCDVRTLVAQYCKSPCAAESLILEYARKGHFKSYRFHGPTDSTHRGISPTFWGAADRKLGVYVIVDFANSTVTYTREEPSSYAFALLVDEILEEFLPSPYYQIQLVHLCRADVLSMLRAVGLLPVQRPTEQTTVPSAESTTGSAGAAGSAGDVVDSAGAVDRAEIRGLQRWVFEQCNGTPPPKRDSDGSYVDGLLERCPHGNVKRHTIHNYISLWRREQRQGS